MANSITEMCRCCLKGGRLKYLWREYAVQGEVEIYGEMLRECFDFNWSVPKSHKELICMSCVSRLRLALEFRREVLASEEVLMMHLYPGGIKQETNDVEGEEEEECIVQEIPIEKMEVEATGSQEDTVEYLDFEYLEEGQEQTENDNEDEDFACAGDDGDDDYEPTETSKWPKKKKKEDRGKVYKQYTQEELQKCLEAVRSKRMTRSEASEHYKVPIKTISGRLKKEGVEPDPRPPQITGKQMSFLKDIRNILTYTNATPYKSKTSRFYCAYCTTDGPMFEDTDELRTHVRTQHASERIRNVDMFMRPYFLNEILRVDITDLKCTVCYTSIDDWNAMFEHITKVHNVEFDEAYTRIVPYLLNFELKCALCHEAFTSFMNLDCHMNEHYNNYICGECGDTFVSESRLKTHSVVHNKAEFPCEVCGKVFTLEKYRAKHFKFVHGGNSHGRVKCVHCKESFPGIYARHHHVLEKHPEKAKIRELTCEYCGKTFTWKPYYLKHVRLAHRKDEKKLACQLCDKKFFQKHELKNHMEWHEGTRFSCEICSKKYSTKAYLMKHMESHVFKVESVEVEPDTDTKVVKVLAY